VASAGDFGLTPLLYIAAALLAGIGFLHSYLGERYILIRLFRRSDLPKLFGGDTFTRRTLRFAWHVTTIAWLGFSLLLVTSAGAAAPEVSLSSVGTAVSATFLASAVLTCAGTRGRHFAWIVFLVIAVLTWLGSR